MRKCIIREVKGPIQVLTDMNKVKNLLLREGFYDPDPLQVQKEGQTFGLVKRVGDLLEMHVRCYDDSTLESEIELSREYLEHPYDCKPYYGPLLDILRSHSMPYALVRQLPSHPDSIEVPKNVTPWKPIAIVAGIFFAALFIGATSRRG